MSFRTDAVRVVTDDYRVHSVPADRLPAQEHILLLAGLARTFDALGHRLDSGLTVHRLHDLPCEPLVVAQRDLILFTAGERSSRSGTSQALYLARSARTTSEGGRSILLQLLPPGSTTSTHYHRRTCEGFINLLGTCELASLPLGDSERPRPRVLRQTLDGSSVVVTPQVVHQMRTGDQSALNVIFMHGLECPVDMSDHVHVSRDLFALPFTQAP